MINKIISLLLVLLLAGCTGSDELVNQSVVDNSVGINNTIVNQEDSVIDDLIKEELIDFDDVICSSLTDASMVVTSLNEDTVVNAKEINVCSVNHDIMNSVNHKYYTFTVAKPTRIYAMIDGINVGKWQVGIINHDWVDGEVDSPVIYSADLEAGEYTLYVRLTNALGSTCLGVDCCFELQTGSTCYWISGAETNKLGYRVTLSTSELTPNSSLEVIASNAPVFDSCSVFNDKNIGLVSHDTIENAYSVSICDNLTNAFTGLQYEYYSLNLTKETGVRITLDKPEGRWQLGVTDYSWQDSVSLGSESVVYENTLPAGEHKVWVMVFNTAGLGGNDWTCRQVVTDGTCYWTSGLPPEGVYYLDYRLTFDFS